jgi:ABC-2 type transport system ATP-binding protein
MASAAGQEPVLRIFERTRRPPPAPEEASVVVEGVVKRYDQVDALRGVNLRIRKGEAFGLLGPNGAGKTTLIQIVTTMVAPTEGDVRVNGNSIHTAAQAVRRDLGVVFQNSTLDKMMSARDNLWIHGRLYKVPKDVLRKRIPELLDLAGLTDRADDRINTYSGGMRRRLEIVRATLHHPRVLLLDEPTVGLDPQSRRVIWEHVARLRKELGMTVLLTTHYLDEADALCERIAIIDHGKIDVVNTPEKLKEALGGDTLDLRLAAPPNGALDALRAIPNVQGVEDDGRDVRVVLREPTVTIPRVMDVLHDAGASVVEMRHKQVSLDDVFVRRTGKSTRDRRRRPKGLAGWLMDLWGPS